MIELIKQPWPWWAGGIIIGLTVPALLILGNRHFGLSANFRHICAACIPSDIPFFNYDWKKEVWNFYFVGGTVFGAFIASYFLSSHEAIKVAPALAAKLQQYGINDYNNLVPAQIISWQSLFTLRGFIIMVLGGFLIGFGTRFAGGCTSGHSIMGLSDLQWPSLIATCCFMIGGFIMANLILPFILSL